jgi:hypothetical protein
LAFTQSIIASGVDPDTIYLTGHSLGGAEAQYVAFALGHFGTNIGGAVTFGAPGIYDGPEKQHNADPDVINYIHYGDPIANYGDHYGQTEYLGSDSFSTITSIVSGIERLAELVNPNLIARTLLTVITTAAAASIYHPQDQYADELDLQLIGLPASQIV